MKLETLAKRLADKTNTPILEQVVLRQAPISALPSECIIWTGATAHRHTRKKPRKSRNSRDGFRMEFIENERETGIIRWQRKTTQVHRLILELAVQPDFRFRMWNTCGQPCCVHPIHFELQEIGSEGQIEIETDWTEDEIEELLEFILMERDPQSWADIQGDPDLEGAPAEMVREVLNRMNKGDLT